MNIGRNNEENCDLTSENTWNIRITLKCVHELFLSWEGRKC